MKFGRNLPRNQVPEWAASYINYKALKKLIKSAAEAVKRGMDADTAGMYIYCTSTSTGLTCVRILLLAG